MGTMEAMYPAYPKIDAPPRRPPRPPRVWLKRDKYKKKLFVIVNSFYVAIVAIIIPNTEIKTFSVVKEADIVYNLNKKTIFF